MLELGLGVDAVSANGERGIPVEHVVLLVPMRLFGEFESPK